VAAGRIDEEELGEVLTDIVEQGLRAGAVIRRLRALFKSGEAQLQPLDVNGLVREVSELAHGELVLHQIELHTSLASKLPPVNGDRIQLQQVLLNLVVNACEAMSAHESGGRLSVETRLATDGSVEIGVADRGPGVASHVQSKLFEPFFTTKREGLGLGLSISRAIVMAHGGRLWCSNNAEQGATFCVALPAHTGERS
jgi:C4-dicarboxylate-specific signal transduction histidine kinase